MNKIVNSITLRGIQILIFIFSLNINALIILYVVIIVTFFL